jgi:hypothetical protein
MQNIINKMFLNKSLWNIFNLFNKCTSFRLTILIISHFMHFILFSFGASSHLTLWYCQIIINNNNYNRNNVYSTKNSSFLWVSFLSYLSQNSLILPIIELLWFLFLVSYHSRATWTNREFNNINDDKLL